MDPEIVVSADISLLYVEDDQHTREEVGRWLKGKVADVRLARDGEEGLRLYREHKPDIVVTNLRMPVMNGLDMARKIQTVSPRAEIILTPGQSDLNYLLEAADREIGRFVVKPVDREELFAAVDRSVLNVLRERTTGDGHEWLEELVLRRTSDLDRTGEALEASVRKVRKTMHAVIQVMIRVIESRDPYTAAHQRNVASLARSLADELVLDEDRIDGIHLAGEVHDIGKVAIPTEILSKPAGLTDLEFSLVRTHPETGHCILKEIDFPWPIARIILQHHERLDGSGYPEGLSGEEIMLEARIIAVADVVDAITSHRPYRPALGLERALEEISCCRGTRYDAEVVDACERLVRSGRYRPT